MKSPIAWAEIQKAVYSWFFAATEVQTAWADQKRPQDDLADAFGTLRVQSLQPEGTPEVRERTANADLYLDAFSSALLTINCQVASPSQDFANHAQNILSRAQAALRLPEFVQDLDLAGLSLVSVSPIANLSAVAGNGFVSRASMDVVFRVVAFAQAETASGYFDKVRITDPDNVEGPDIGPVP